MKNELDTMRFNETVDVLYNVYDVVDLVDDPQIAKLNRKALGHKKMCELFERNVSVKKLLYCHNQFRGISRGSTHRIDIS